MSNGNGYLGLLKKYEREEPEVYDPEKEGWFAEVPGDLLRKSRPIYEEGEDWIMDFAQGMGRSPTWSEYSDWQVSQDIRGFSYTPESTMGKLGWEGKTWEDYRKWGQPTYGPGAGEFVPENAIVLTDQFGNPIYRTSEFNDVTGGFINRGQYLANPQGFSDIQMQNLGQYGVGPGEAYRPRDISQYYPQKEQPPGQPLWNEPALEDFFRASGHRKPYELWNDYFTSTALGEGQKYETGGSINPDIYRAQLTDYLDQRMDADFLEGKKLDEEWEEYIKKAKIMALVPQTSAFAEEWLKSKLADINARAEELMTEEKKAELLAEIEIRLRTGNTEGLPFADEDIMGRTTGKNLMNLFSQYTGSKKRGWEQEYADWEREENIRKYGVPDLSMVPGEQEIAPTGNEMGEYFQYIRSLQLAGTFENHYLNGFSFYYNLWRTEGPGMPFIEWFSNYLMSGG